MPSRTSLEARTGGAGHSKCISLGVPPSICKVQLDAGIARKKEEIPGAIAVFALAPIALVWFIIGIVHWVRRDFQPKTPQEVVPSARN